MRSAKGKKPDSPKHRDRLTELEERSEKKGVHLHYDRLEAAGLKLKGGLCRINGEYHFFIDRREPVSAKIELIEDLLDRPLPEETPDYRPSETSPPYRNPKHAPARRQRPDISHGKG